METNFWATEDIYVGQRLKLLRDSLGVSQDQFAAQTCVSLACYRNYESGKRSVSKGFILSLAETFDLSPTWFLTGTGQIWLKGKPPEGVFEGRLKAGQFHLQGPGMTQVKLDNLSSSKSPDSKDQIFSWIEAWWKGASEKEKIWFEVHFEQAFPQYLRWLKAASSPQDPGGDKGASL